MPFDVDQITAENRLSEIVGRVVNLTADGREHRGLCPFHDEQTPSFSVVDHKRFYHCFGCGAHGDVIAFVRDYYRVTFTEACEILGGKREMPAVIAAKTSRAAVEANDPYAELEAQQYGGALPRAGERLRVYNPKRAKWTTYSPSMVFPYFRPRTYKLIGLVVRIDLDDGKKITPQLRYAKLPDGSVGWCAWYFDKPRPLYAAERIKDDGKQIIVVEGEKAADAAMKLLPLSVVTWPGGGKGIAHVDWSALSGRSVILWGDADQPGEDTMLGYTASSGEPRAGVAELVTAAGATAVKYATWDRSKPKGWDAADALRDGWDQKQTIEWLRSRATVWHPRGPDAAGASRQLFNGRGAGNEPSKPSDHEAPLREVGAYTDNGHGEPWGGGESNEADDTAPLPPLSDEDSGWPFRVLGYNKDSFYYFPKRSQQVIELSAAAHSINNLLRLAPMHFWEQTFPTRRSAPFDLPVATNALMQTAYSAGIFSERRVRGRGAWMDEGKAVMHLGHVVMVDGEAINPTEVQSKFLYERKEPLSIAAAEPATAKEAHRLVDVVERVTWANKLSGALLAGWCVTAPVCGALHWRSGIWITGPANSGKTTMVDVVNRVVGPIAERADGTTTEAALRQLMMYDARPIIVDEIESETRQQRELVSGVLRLARVASSGGRITKGVTTGGEPVTYVVRSSFCFSSINTAISEGADERRISRLVLRKNTAADREAHYVKLAKDINDWLTQDFAERMLARTVKYLPVLLQNIRTFTTAAAAVLKDRGAADQLGGMIAGYHLCHSSKEIDVDTAIKWLRERNWSEHTAMMVKADERKLLTYIMMQRRRLTHTTSGQSDYTIGEMIEWCESGGLPEHLSARETRRELGRIGIKADEHAGGFIISNDSPDLRRMLSDTPWAKDWRVPLRQIVGAKPAEPLRFSPGLVERGTFLPIDLLKDDATAPAGAPTMEMEYDGSSD